MLEVTRDEAGSRAAVALRISLEELRAKNTAHYESEAHGVVSLLSDVPDLWDVKMDSSPTDCGASRFEPEGAHEPVIDFVKRMTDRLSSVWTLYRQYLVSNPARRAGFDWRCARQHCRSVPALKNPRWQQ